MNNADKSTNEAALKNVLESFISAYAERDKNIVFTCWLAEKLRHEIPGISPEVSERLSMEITEAVAAYDQTLSELNKAVELGQSKEEWLADRVIENCANMPNDTVGEKLRQIENSYNASNTQLVQIIEDSPENADIIIDTEIVDWNEYSVKNAVLNVGRQAAMSGLCVITATIKNNIENVKTANDAGGLIGQALRDEIETVADEVKAVVAGALKTAAEEGLTDIMPEDTPVETICDIAGAAVESASALIDAASGKSTMVEALDKAGRASIAAASRICAGVIKGTLSRIPYVGAIIVHCAGHMVDKTATKITETVYPVVRDTVRTAWEGIKQTSRSIWNKMKNSIANFLHD